MKFIKNTLVGEALSKEKRKDFRNVVILQFLIISAALMLDDILTLMGIQESYVFRDIFFLLLGGLYVLILWDMLRNFTQNKALIISMFILIMGTYILALVTVNPIWKIFITDEEKRPYLFFIHFILFSVEATVIFFAIKDIFSGNKMSQEKLWGSACIYLMIAISFGSVYDLISIAHPGSMGIPLKLGLDSYTACIAYSMTILGGQEPAFSNPIPLVTNLGIFESVWANLFIVLLVGRLLGQPDADKN
ncbi:MAG: hypothetical protein K2X86_07450 [Cytophagaceae bacterium]|nr:hypothetical protein [Cytophagaceae bacterium]